MARYSESGEYGEEREMRKGYPEDDVFIRRALVSTKYYPVNIRERNVGVSMRNRGRSEDYAPSESYAPRSRSSAVWGGYAPVLRINEHRGLLKNIFLGLLTLGFYPFVISYRMSQEINLIASRYDGKRTMNFAMMTMLILFTAGIAYLVWETKFCMRIKDELGRRGIDYKFGAGSFWGWNTIGCLLFGLGPFIFTHKQCKAMNLLAQHYNTYG